ncbi:low molecular weight phosphatase family protein [Galbibacter pacificus]|uniref:Protein-tyrosine-phosphatase n=1 Tax=Galbibacter pacificus TaxID=2996052 RepID=A0ABT6FQN4_9FLAO|nr:protein-tyrosine-phosphatase [Galbibacter pacificus]MDG3581991.1 protein-tyrosine-phosphatase [Galbibacter pacificus]MDG3585535.1 protein-tyrosine-phosphatase [Galbibacter pacificus]
MYLNLQEKIAEITLLEVTKERKEIFKPLIEYVNVNYSKNKRVTINFICTHNSRRSHLAQVWAQTMAYHFGIKKVACYSGGTEATAVFPMVTRTLKEQGFRIQTLSEGKNPVYAIKYAENEHPIIGFSKRYDDVFNPENGFAAIMTCSQADTGCPFIAGAEKRIPITYNDPKEFDDSLEQAKKYMERSNQIAVEMWYVFSQINK